MFGADLNFERFADRGSRLNAQPVALGASFESDVGWQPALGPVPDDAADVPARVRASAGAGRLWVSP